MIVFLNAVENAVKKVWDFIISMKKNKREGNSVEKFCISLLYPILLAKKKERKCLILFLNFLSFF